jgi:predicted ATP-dependent endonuclease of OLD family
VNSLKLVSLQVDDTYIHFRDGLNYIVGRNASGKTTIFNCIKYVLGMVKLIHSTHIRKIELKLHIDSCEFLFKREVGNLILSVYQESVVHRFRAQSKELDSFFRENLEHKYIYDGKTESALKILDFCFLTEEKSVNRRGQWDALSSICGVNVFLLDSVEKDIYALKREVSKNKELENVVDEFSVRLKEVVQLSELDEKIEKTKFDFFRELREKEELLINATLKFDEIKKRSNFELRKKIAEVEYVFTDMKHQAGLYRNNFEGLEEFIKDRSKSISYGEEIFYRFILVLAISQIAQNDGYNFPYIIINDSYLSRHLDNNTYYQAKIIINRLMSRSEGLQYIEFTNRDDIPKEHIVLDLNTQGGLHVFGN